MKINTRREFFGLHLKVDNKLTELSYATKNASRGHTVFRGEKEIIGKWEELTNCDFNWNTGVDAVLVVEINTIDIKALQAGLTSCSHVCWIATDHPLPILKTISELGC